MVDIGIFDSYKINTVVFSPLVGKYAVYTEKGKLTELSPNSMVQVAFDGQKVKIYSLDKNYGSFSKVNFIGLEWENSFKIKPVSPAKYVRKYKDNFKVRPAPYYDKLLMINNIELGNYIAGVVEAEVGKNPPEEFFKLQAIICRTYALSNIDRHGMNGFNLCDAVHCQAYHGMPKSNLIDQAAKETKGIVIVDDKINLITAAFHSNCGGFTVNSEDAWTSPLSYLKSVRDTFCLSENNSTWKRKIPREDWEDYLLYKYQYDFNEEVLTESGNQLESRNCYLFADTSHTIPLKEVRKDLKLKSTFFVVDPEDQYILVKGRGYGHGVGLCQEGAMRMAETGYSYAEILHYYYRNVHMVHLSALDFFRTD